jgi:two-component system, OmpR family, sensor kinase
VSLRARLVAALVALFTVGLVVYGVGTYQAFERAQLARLDDDIRSTVPLVVRELTGRSPRPFDEVRHAVIAPPGTFARLHGPDGTVLRSRQVSDAVAEPDLSGVSIDRAGMSTVPSVGTGPSWRVAVVDLTERFTAVVAVPMTSVERSLDRLVVIESVAGATLLALLGAGAWLILRSGLRPLERMAATARSINAGSLDQRVEVAGRDSEVDELATALNGMLDELEDAFAQREATEARLRRFLADASHELRTPLTSIQGYAELFRIASDAEHVDLPTILRRIEDESGRMGRLVDDLLTLARLDETHEPSRAPVDLAVLAADACSDAVATAPGRPVSLDAPGPVPVTGDAGHLHQAIGNLVGNALRHTPPGTPIEVSVAAVDGEAVVRVRDHGPGLDDEALGHAFDRFWRADPARGGRGAGLGLSIVRAVAAEHGGRATAANADGGGAEFTLVLPVGVSADAASGAPSDPPTDAPAGAPARTPAEAPRGEGMIRDLP